MKLTIEIEKQVLSLNEQNYTKDEIAEILHISRRSVFTILKKNRVPKEIIKDKKQYLNINEVLSIHLLKNCEDIELLTKMFASTVCYQKIEKISVPERVSNAIGIDKIKKIVSLTERAGLKLDIDYGKKIFA